MASPVLMEAADEEPEDLVPGLEAGPALRTKSHLELLAEQKILEQEMTAAANALGRVASRSWQSSSISTGSPIGLPDVGGESQADLLPSHGLSLDLTGDDWARVLYS